MKLQRFLSKSRIIDLSETSFPKAIAELLKTIPDSILGKADRSSIVADITNREKAICTYLDNGACMPHTRVKGLKQKYIFAVGRCPNGLSFNGVEDYEKTRLVFLLLADLEVDTYLQVLSKLARLFSDEENISKIVNSSDLHSLKDSVMALVDGRISQESQKPPSKKSLSDLASVVKPAPAKGEDKINSLIARSAVKIAKVAKCSTILLQADSFTNIPELSRYFGDFNVVLITEKGTGTRLPRWDVINVRSFSKQRFSQLRSAIMIGLTRGIFSPKDKICCIGGVKDSNKIDSIIVLDIAREFSELFIQRDTLPEGVKPEVIERVIDIATELSVEGREGKPVGCIFVIGNVDKLKPHLKQLILNPFYGYNPEDRNVLSPFMDETVKEYSLIDGAFIVDGSGIMEAAGALIHTPDFKLQLPGGLGARHAAAYSISLMCDCISIVVSSSTGQVTIFRKGQMLPLTEKKKS